MLQSVPFLPLKIGNQAKKPGPEMEVLTGASSPFRGPETQQGSGKAPGWGKERRGITMRVSVALEGGKSFLLSHPGIHPRELKTCPPKNLYTRVHSSISS